MSESNLPPVYNFYIDDSGTRNPDKAPPCNGKADWFALGGVLIGQEHESQARALHAVFCEKWKITYPLHSSDIRHKSKDFLWLSHLQENCIQEFFNDLERLALDMPVLGHACVIDRPGYRKRYYEKYGKQRWHLCKTAFAVVVERAIKFSISNGRRLRLLVEASDKDSDNRIKAYYNELREVGMPFSEKNSDLYKPISVEDIRNCVIDLKFKKKTSPIMQIADIYLYPICRSRYDTSYKPMKILMENKKTIDCEVEPSEIGRLGIKYSCFDTQ